MKRVLAVLLSVLMLVTLIAPTFVLADETMVFELSADKEYALKGDTITITVNVTQNPGFVAIVAFPSFDKTNLTQDGNATKGSIGNMSAGKNFVVDGGDEDNTDTGFLGSFTVKVNENAALGDYTFTLTLSGKGAGVANQAEEDVPTSVVAVTVHVVDELPCAHDGTKTEHPAVPATCTEAGHAAYTTCDLCQAVISGDATTIGALGHNYGEASYTWAADNSTCTATRTCSRDASHVETEPVNTTSNVTTPAGCTTAGVTTYTATFTNEAFAQRTKDVENIPANGHTWGEASYEWAQDHTTCTARRTCSECQTEEEETVTAVKTSGAAATCTTAGGGDVYTATFTKAGFETQQFSTGNIPALGHDLRQYDAKDATCTEVGWYAYEECQREGCNYTTYQEISALGHDYGEAGYQWAADNKTCTASHTCTRVGCTDETTGHVETETVNTTPSVKVPATCTEAGTTTYTATFTKAGFTQQKKTVEGTPAATGHTWGAPEYSWRFLQITEGAYPKEVTKSEFWRLPAEERVAECTATRTCGNNSEHVDSETVTAVPDGNGRTYTATFEEEAFKDQRITKPSSGGSSSTTPAETTKPEELPIEEEEEELEFTSGIDRNLTFTTDTKDPVARDSVKVTGEDGTERTITEDDYTDEDGVLTLKEAFLNRLPAGKYTITFQRGNGVVTAEFTVEAAQGTASAITGDDMSLVLWSMIALVSMAGVVVSGTKIRIASEK